MMQMLTVTAGGTYTVTVTDMNGCTGTASVEVTENPLPTPSIGGPTSFCLGSAATLDAGDDYDMYMWSNGFMTQTIAINNPGVYTVTVTDTNGCMGTASTTITIDLPPTATASSNGPICEGQTAMIMASGGTSYAWLGPTGTSTLAKHHLGKHHHQQSRYLYRHRHGCEWLYGYGSYVARNQRNT